jgi:hypothetical protein
MPNSTVPARYPQPGIDSVSQDVKDLSRNPRQSSGGSSVSLSSRISHQLGVYAGMMSMSPCIAVPTKRSPPLRQVRLEGEPMWSEMRVLSKPGSSSIPRRSRRTWNAMPSFVLYCANISGSWTFSCIFDSHRRSISGVDGIDRILAPAFVERQNLTMRMGMRRFTRLTNGFSKKIDDHAHMVALHFP